MIRVYSAVEQPLRDKTRLWYGYDYGATPLLELFLLEKKRYLFKVDSLFV